MKAQKSRVTNRFLGLLLLLVVSCLVCWSTFLSPRHFSLNTFPGILSLKENNNVEKLRLVSETDWINEIPNEYNGSVSPTSQSNHDNLRNDNNLPSNTTNPGPTGTVDKSDNIDHEKPDKSMIPSTKIISTNGAIKSRWDSCQQQLVVPVSQLQREWYELHVPLLHTITHMPEENVDKLVFILNRKIKVGERHSWVVEANWTCGRGGKPALAHGWEANNNTLINLGPPYVFELTCPTMTKEDDIVTVTKTDLNDTVRTMEYNISAWTDCRMNQDPELGIPEGSTYLLACVMVQGMRYQLAQWIEYHRLIGFQHFLVYLHEPYNAAGDYINDKELPQAADITYIPWNYELSRNEAGQKSQIPYQAAEWHDCRLRARARNVTWLSDHDVDEYYLAAAADDGSYDASVASNTTVLSVLKEYESDPKLAAFLLQSWFHNSAGARQVHPANDSMPVGSYRPTLVVDNIWRTKEPYTPALGGSGHHKLIVRPRRIQYAAFHKVLLTEGNKYEIKTDETRLRMYHYKRTDTGAIYIKNGASDSTAVQDSRFRDQYGSLIRDRLGLGPRAPDKEYHHSVDSSSKGNQRQSTPTKLLVPGALEELKKNPGVRYHFDNAIMLHLPKSGGGSYRHRMEELSFHFNRCHPKPCPERLLQSEIMQGLITIRDPIDRFQSSFYWKKLLACRANNETREPHPSAFNDPDTLCRELSPEEYKVLFVIAEGDASKLAEKVCPGVPKDVQQKMWKETGFSHDQLRRIGFMREQITDWIPGFLNLTNGNQIELSPPVELMAVVLEPGYNYTKQIDSTIKEMLTLEYGREEAAVVLQQRQKLVGRDDDSSRQRRRLPEFEFDAEVERHASRSSNRTISELGSCCLTKHFLQDYELISRMRKSMCTGDASDICVAAINAILHRRRRYMDDHLDCNSLI